MREALRWAVRKPRVWLATAGFLAATVLALADDKPAWAAFVVTATGILAWSAIAAQYAHDHPDSAARARANEQARVAAVLSRYEAAYAARQADPEPAADPAPKPPRLPRRRRREQARVEAILWRYERQRLARERAREQR